MGLVVTETEAIVFLDDVEIGRQAHRGTADAGYVGLVTSLAAVDFADFQLTLEGD